MNMGAWSFVEPLLRDVVKDRLPLRYLGRPRYSSTAEGSSAWHAYNQKKLVEKACLLESKESPEPGEPPRAAAGRKAAARK